MVPTAFWPAADEVMNRLEHDPLARHVVAAVNQILDRLEADPHHPSLHSRAFVTEAYGGVNATPIGKGDWYVLWQAPEDVVEIVLIHELRF